MDATTPQGVAGQDLETQFDTMAGLIADDKPQEAEQPQTQAVEQPGAQQAPENTAQQPDEQPQEAAPSYANLDEFLTDQKLDPEAFRALPVRVKVDGIERDVPLAEVIKSFQLESHVNNKSIELSNQQRAMAEEQQAARTLISQQVQQAQMLGNVALQQLNADFQRIDWNGLRATNPAEFAALQAEFGQRQQQIQAVIQQAQAHHQAEQQQQQQTLAQQIEIERQRMYDKFPEWRDTAKFTAARDQISTYAKAQGFNDAELAQIYDHRYLQVLHDAASFRALQAGKPEALKKLREAPPMAKAGARQTTDPQAAQRQAVFQRLNANPRDEDAQAAAFDFFARG